MRPAEISFETFTAASATDAARAVRRAFRIVVPTGCSGALATGNSMLITARLRD